MSSVTASISRQLRALQTAPPEGVRLTPSDSGSLSEIFAEIDGPVETPYVGGVFRLKLCLGPDYPAAPPKGERSRALPLCALLPPQRPSPSAAPACRLFYYAHLPPQRGARG